MATNSDRDERASAFAWLSALGIAVFILVFTKNGLRHWVKEPDLSQLAELLVKRHLGSCAPEPLEQARYIFTIFAFPLLFTAALNFLRRITPEKLAILRSPLWTFFAQAGLVYFLAFNWRRQDAGIHQYFSNASERWALAIGAVFAFAAPFLSAAWKRRPFVRRPSIGRVVNVGAVLVAGGLVALYAWTTVFTEKNIGLSFSIVHVHIDHFSEEFAGLLMGKTPLVDYFPQYQNLLPALLSPWFRLIGFDTFRFTLTMAILSSLGVAVVFRILWGLTGSAVRALPLFAAFVGIAYFGYRGEPGQVLNSFNYWGVWPMRQFMPYLSLLVLYASLQNPTTLRIAFSFAFASVTALNNLDFGIPALVGVWAAQLVAAPGGLHQNAGRTLKRLLPLAALGLFGTLAGFAIWARVRAGDWPDFGRILTFQRIYARYGFFAIPGPTFGLHMVITVTFLAAFASALYLHFFTERPTKSSSTLAGLLTFSAIFGCGSLMYYINRSHPMVLSAIFANWALAVVFLGLLWVPRLIDADFRVAILPRWILGAALTLFLWQLRELPSFSRQAQRFRREDSISVTRRELLRRQVEAYTAPGEATYLMIYTGHEVAFRSGRRNLFPFPHPNSILLKEQVEIAGRPLRQSPEIRKIVAVFPKGQEKFYSLPEFRALIEGLGFRPTATQDLLTAEVTELWERP